MLRAAPWLPAGVLAVWCGWVAGLAEPIGAGEASLVFPDPSVCPASFETRAAAPAVSAAPEAPPTDLRFSASEALGESATLVEGEWNPGGQAVWLDGQSPGPLRRLGRYFHTRAAGAGPPRDSWLYRPLSFEWMLGECWGGSLIDNWVEQRRGMFGALRIGWDVNAYWGWKMRFALAETTLVDSMLAIEAQQARDRAAGLSETDAYYYRFSYRREADFFFWDIDFVYYPLGDTRLRPYLALGLGTVNITFMDRLDYHYSELVLGMPVAVGLKYRCSDWLAVLCEATDNVAFSGGKGINTLHQFSLVGGMELRFGGARRTYWPWNPSRTSW